MQVAYDGYHYLDHLINGFWGNCHRKSSVDIGRVLAKDNFRLKRRRLPVKGKRTWVIMGIWGKKRCGGR
jgi:hypothetical protein